MKDSTKWIIWDLFFIQVSSLAIRVNQNWLHLWITSDRKGIGCSLFDLSVAFRITHHGILTNQFQGLGLIGTVSCSFSSFL